MLYPHPPLDGQPSRVSARDTTRPGFSTRRANGHTRSKSLSDRAVGSGSDAGVAGGAGLKEGELMKREEGSPLDCRLRVV